MKYLYLILLILQFGFTDLYISHTKDVEGEASSVISKETGDLVNSNEINYILIRPTDTTKSILNFWLSLIECEQEEENENKFSKINENLISFQSIYSYLPGIENYLSNHNNFSSFPSLYLKIQVFRL